MFYLAVLSGNAGWLGIFLARQRGEEGERDEWEGGKRTKKGDPRFLFYPIRPILSLLPVLALKKIPAMLRCQIKRLKKTDPKEPYWDTYTLNSFNKGIKGLRD
jgi:hypothetical protein